MDEFGFTLIELMVVTAIVGILTALTIPNYERYRRRSMQAEAKFYLASGYALEKAFYSEYSAYIPAHEAIGYSPEGTKRLYIHNHCETDAWAGSVTGYSGAKIVTYYLTLNSPFSVAYSYNPSNGCSPWPQVTCSSIPSDPQSFNLSAIGKLCATCYDDVWVINQYKQMRNCSNGL